MKTNRQTTKKNIEEEEKDTFDFAKKGIIAVIVLFIFFSFYILTLYITSKHNEEDSTTDYPETEEQTPASTATSYENIMLGRSLSMSDADYYVICYDKTADNASNFSSIINNYTSLDEHLDIYSVDLSSSFNKKYLTEGESNKNPTDTSSFAINGPTLFKVSNHAVVDYVEGEEEISNYLS